MHLFISGWWNKHRNLSVIQLRKFIEISLALGQKINEFTLSSPLVCDTIPIGLGTSGTALGQDVVSTTPTGDIQTVWVCGLRRSRWRRVPYPGVRAVIQATWFLFQTLEAKAQPSTIKHGRAPILNAGSISRSVTEIFT